jgi:hypothetical protein
MAAGVDRRLERLLEIYEQAARSLRTAIALLNQGAPTVASPSSNGGDRKSAAYTLAAKLDAARRASFKAPPTLPGVKIRNGPKPKPGGSTDRIRRQRATSARFLALFSTDEPRRATKGARPFGSLVRRGYLRKVAGGYIRTDKPYAVDGPA